MTVMLADLFDDLARSSVILVMTRFYGVMTLGVAQSSPHEIDPISLSGEEVPLTRGAGAA